MSFLYYVVSALLFFILAVIYFVPTWIALARRHRSAVGVLMVNIFTAWTVLGWIFALFWALTGERTAQLNESGPNPDNPGPP